MPTRILITAGPTVEDIDPVRFISNRATGKLGVALARAALRAGHAVVLIHGPLSESVLQTIPRNSRLITVPVRSAADMHRAVMRNVKSVDAVIMNAAVADFTPIQVSADKLKKARQGLTLRLKPTIDILAELGRLKARRKGLVLAGFALESGSGHTEQQRQDSRTSEALRKLNAKNLDLIVLDTPRTMAADTGEFTVILRNGVFQRIRTSKAVFAGKLVKIVQHLLNH